MSDLEFRLTRMSDAIYLEQWLADPAVFKFFPMFFDCEYKEAATRWVFFSRYRCSLTAYREGKPCGITTLYLQPYHRLRHQSELGIIVAPEMRRQGVGSALLQQLFVMAERDFKLELLHLQVYYDNPAIALYRKLGFVEFGRQERFMKEEDGSYSGRIFMEKSLR